jgi:hypothetical protein
MCLAGWKRRGVGPECLPGDLFSPLRAFFLLSFPSHFAGVVEGFVLQGFVNKRRFGRLEATWYHSRGMLSIETDQKSGLCCIFSCRREGSVGRSSLGFSMALDGLFAPFLSLSVCTSFMEWVVV